MSVSWVKGFGIARAISPDVRCGRLGLRRSIGLGNPCGNGKSGKDRIMSLPKVFEPPAFSHFRLSDPPRYRTRHALVLPAAWLCMSDIPDSPSPRRGIPGWLGVAVRIAATIGLMAWALKDVDWGQFGAIIAQARWWWFVAAVVVTVLVQSVAGVRWAALARPLGFDFPRWFFVRRFFEGMFFSLCLPSSIGGDVIKAVRIGKTAPARLLAACSVVVDRLTGLSALGVLVGTAVVTREYGLGMPGAAIVFAAFLAAVLVAFRVGLMLLDRIHDWLPEGSGGREFVARLLPYRQQPSLVLAAVGWSFVVQMGGAVSVALVGRALGVDQPLIIWFSVVPLVALAMVLPISIGGFGVRENALEYLLRGYGVPSETGVAIALLWGLCTVFAGLLGGLLFLLERRPLEAAASTPAAATQ